MRKLRVIFNNVQHRVPETNERAGDGDSGIPCMQIRTSLGFENSARVVIDGASTAASRKSLKLKWLEKG